MVSLTISRVGKPLTRLEFSDKQTDSITISDVKSAIQIKMPKLVANRQRLSFLVADGKFTPLIDESRTLASYGVSDGEMLRLKDLGRQVGYRALYLLEYIGPIFLNPLWLHYSHLLWGEYTPSSLQILIRNFSVLHFTKRFLESAFIHHFSRATVPFSYIFRNCAYYWGMCGLLMGLTLYRPAYSAQALKGSLLDNSSWMTFWTGFIIVNEALNLHSHIHLRSLRVSPGQPRKYPTGFGFGTAVCANYWFETNVLISLLALTGLDIGTIAYVSVAVFFMQLWSGQKYRRYRKEFDPNVFPGKRWKMFPLIY